MEELRQPGDATFANAIERSKKNGKLYCNLCAKYLQNQSAHCVEHTHKVLLERCKSVFEDRGKNFHCKDCNRSIRWDVLKDHAWTHKLQPWYDIEKPVCELYYHNHTVKYKFGFYCFLCEKPLDFWDSACAHFEEIDHRKRKHTFGQAAYVLANDYSLASSHGIIPGPNAKIECKACGLIGLKPEDIREHVKTAEHKKNEEKLVAHIVAKSKEKQSLKSRESASNSSQAQESTSESLKAQPSEKLDKINQAHHSHGMICNFTLEKKPQESPENRGKAARSEDSGKIKADEVPDSPCEVSQHPPLVQPLNFIVSSASDLCRSIVGNDNHRKRKIARLSKEEPDPYCVICYSEIPGEIAVRDHLEGKRHRESSEKYGCAEIQSIDGEHYFCACCDCTISGFAGVYRHITSNTHLSLVAGEPGQSTSTAISIHGEDAREIVKPTSDCLACIYIVKQNAKKSFCQICDVTQFPVATKSINDHVASQRHKIALARYGCEKIVAMENGNYRCECCSCELANIEAVHLHVKEKRHASLLIKVYRECVEPRKNKRRIEMRAESPTSLDQQEIHGNLLSSYIARQINRSSFSGNQEQRGMISNFTVEPDDAVDWFGPSRNSRLGDNSGVHGFGFVGSQRDPKLNTQIFSALLARSGEKKTIAVVEAPVKKYHCTVCDAAAENRTLLHVHMASHYTEEFARVRKHRQTAINGSSTNRPTSDEVEPETQRTSTFLANDLESFDPQTPRMFDDEENRRETRPTTTKETPRKDGKSWKVAKMRKVAEQLDFVRDDIYDLPDKLADLELGIILGLVVNLESKKIYCLICRELVRCSLEDYPEHLTSIDHCEYLEEMESDKRLFQDHDQQLSDLDLANEYMQEISEDAVRCVICDEDVANEDRALEAHIYHEIHERKCEETRALARRHYEEIAPRVRCDWYDVKSYWCVECRSTTDSEVKFVDHLRSPGHGRKMKNPENRGKRMIFDFCRTCALLWYGYRSTYAYHSEIESHKWLKRDGHYVFEGLSLHAKRLLASPAEFVDEKIKYQDAIMENESARESRVIADLEKAVTMRFPRARAYVFGSRVSRLGSEDSDVDVFLDCRNVYNGNVTTRSDLLFFMNGVNQSLSKDPQLWDVEELLSHCRSPIIRVCHRATGLSCDISFENGLAVENTKLIKAFNQVFPMCRKIILFLKQWLLDCDLSGSGKITSYALYWCVIFYLQSESILPSVAELIAMRRKSHIVAGWEVGVTYAFTYNEELTNLSLKQFLIRFFTFYADFDFRYDVVCPLTGEVMKKRAFIYPDHLPTELKLYAAYMRSPGKPEPLAIDSPMCVQDPFDLQHNLTKAVSKVQLNRFRKCCARSLDLLWSS